LQIKALKLKNFRGIEKQRIELLPNMNVFVGINGSGKSTILDAIAISLSWFVEGIQKIESEGENIPYDSIQNNKDYASIKLEVSQSYATYQWENIAYQRAYPADKFSNLLQLNQLVFEYQNKYKQTNQLPLIAYYPINRIAQGIQNTITGTESISQLDVYDNALGSQANFQSFFEWFRLQDDIINEHTTSQRKWMKNHRAWIFLKLKDALSHLKNYNNSEKWDKFIQRFKEDNFLLDNPRHLLFELMDFLHFMDNDTNHYIEHLLHRMGRLIDREEEYNIRLEDRYLDEIKRILQKIITIKIDNTNHLNFTWDIFLLFLELKFWRLSSKGRQDIEEHFNHSKPTKNMNIANFIAVIQKILLDDTKRLKQALVNQGRELEVVTQTIEKFIPEYKNLRVTRIPVPHMLIEKNNKTLSLNQLSDGEKNMIAMVGDIARRLSMANPNLDNPLEGDGIVMIDEVDLHLHPNWQQRILVSLEEAFPNIQFIVTTHSPQVLTTVKSECIQGLTYENDNLKIQKFDFSLGAKSHELLYQILGISERPQNIEIVKDLNRYLELVDENLYSNQEAIKLRKKLDAWGAGKEKDLLKADMDIKLKEYRRKKYEKS
jgi:predicted ATP-binding protein involved in virulence